MFYPGHWLNFVRSTLWRGVMMRDRQSCFRQGKCSVRRLNAKFVHLWQDLPGNLMGEISDKFIVCRAILKQTYGGIPGDYQANNRDAQGAKDGNSKPFALSRPQRV